MAQNIYDDSGFFAGYSQLDRSVHGLAGAAEWPAIQDLIPDLVGKRVVDLGCGFGWFSRWARERGATSVLGLDISERMLGRARAETSDAAVRYEVTNLDTLELPVGSFDFAYSSLAFHYVADFARLVGMIHAALVPGASLIFTIEHPIYMAAANPGWMADRSGRKTWPVNGYAEEGRRTTDWLAPDVVKYHRRIATAVNALIEAGFVLRRMVEWSPAPEQIEADPRLAEEMERPMILILAVDRP